MPSFLTSGSFSASKFPSIANPSSIPWRPSMRTRFIFTPMVSLALLSSTPAFAVCPNWMLGPFSSTTLAGPNGANATVMSSTIWSGELVIGGDFGTVQGVPASGVAARDPP
jgi:hypothetical protein